MIFFTGNLLCTGEKGIICSGCCQESAQGLENQFPVHEKRKGDTL
jgi:hypothetical protein